LRIDPGVGDTDVVGTKYDPLLAKLIAHDSDRATALAALRGALEETRVFGVTTNRGFLGWLLQRPEVTNGDLHTGLIDEQWQPSEELPGTAWSAAAAALSAAQGDVGFRLNAPRSLRVQIGQEERAVAVGTTRPAAASLATDGASVVLDVDGRSVVAHLAPAPTVEAAISHATHDASAGARVVAPMPGTVIAVRVEEGAEVDAGQVLVVLEAMKMENTVAAPVPGRVERVLVTAGQQVQRSETLVELL
jgi:acetyl/propionyl-CoA carboxylase alpha subunit